MPSTRTHENTFNRHHHAIKTPPSFLSPTHTLATAAGTTVGDGTAIHTSTSALPVSSLPTVDVSVPYTTVEGGRRVIGRGGHRRASVMYCCCACSAASTSTVCSDDPGGGGGKGVGVGWSGGQGVEM